MNYRQLLNLLFKQKLKQNRKTTIFFCFCSCIFICVVSDLRIYKRILLVGEV